jgi:SAM-dependent methyltransferase
VTDGDDFDAFERDGWATNSADAYDRVLGLVTRHVIDDLLDAAHVRAGCRVLDVATGPGYVAGRAAERGATVVGVDRSPQMLELARRAYPALRFVEADAESLDGAGDNFDVVVANFLVLHLGHPERAIAAMTRSTAPGGYVAVTAWSPPERARLFGVFGDAVRAAGASVPAAIPAGPDFFRFGDDRELSALLASAGLVDVAVRAIDYLHPIADAAQLWWGMSEGTVRTRALLQLQPEPMRRAIRAEFERALEPYRSAGGGFAVPVSVKLASGRR